MSYRILFEGVCFTLSYSTHTWSAYVDANLLKIQNAKNEAYLLQRLNTFDYFETIVKSGFLWTLKNTWSEVIIGCMFGKLW